jgi:hypothetical protein
MQLGNVDRRVWYAVIGVAVLAFIGFTIYNMARRPVSGGYIRIVNIRELTRGRPTDRLALTQIEHGLYNKVNQFMPVKSNSVKDMKVRAETFEQVEDDGYHRVSMIVDSESLRMSFRFFYQWGDETRFEQYGGLIFCVQPEDVIFEDFKCEDMSTIQSIDDSLASAISNILPVTTFDYQIRANISVSPPEILITVRVDSDKADDATVELIYQSALAWLNQQRIDVSKYIIRKSVSIFPVN